MESMNVLLSLQAVVGLLVLLLHPVRSVSFNAVRCQKVVGALFATTACCVLAIAVRFEAEATVEWWVWLCTAAVGAVVLFPICYLAPILPDLAVGVYVGLWVGSVVKCSISFPGTRYGRMYHVS